MQSFLQNPCDPGCKIKTWRNMAVEMLRSNDVNVNKFVFSDNLPEVLSKGMGKNRNLIITDP